jgi:hypothetical protein
MRPRVKVGGREFCRVEGKNTSEEKKAQGLGDRTLGTAYDFMHDLAERLVNRVQLTTDGHRVYLEAVESAFNEDIDYAMLSKIYRASGGPETRYSPAVCIGISGTPDPKHVSTSYVGLLMRSRKKLENHAAMVSLYFMYYDFGRVHQTLRVTPAMEAGIADHVWSVEEIVRLLEN